jgi:hypothetical protein
MADVTLQVVVPDQHVARVKAAAEGIFGESYTPAQLKAKIEDGLARHVRDIVIQWEQQEAARIARAAVEDEVNF